MSKAYAPLPDPILDINLEPPPIVGIAIDIKPSHSSIATRSSGSRTLSQVVQSGLSEVIGQARQIRAQQDSKHSGKMSELRRNSAVTSTSESSQISATRATFTPQPRATGIPFSHKATESWVPMDPYLLEPSYGSNAHSRVDGRQEGLMEEIKYENPFSDFEEHQSPADFDPKEEDSPTDPHLSHKAEQAYHHIQRYDSDKGLPTLPGLKASFNPRGNMTCHSSPQTIRMTSQVGSAYSQASWVDSRGNHDPKSDVACKNPCQTPKTGSDAGSEYTQASWAGSVTDSSPVGVGLPIPNVMDSRAPKMAPDNQAFDANEVNHPELDWRSSKMFHLHQNQLSDGNGKVRKEGVRVHSQTNQKTYGTLPISNINPWSRPQSHIDASTPPLSLPPKRTPIKREESSSGWKSKPYISTKVKLGLLQYCSPFEPLLSALLAIVVAIIANIATHYNTSTLAVIAEVPTTHSFGNASMAPLDQGQPVRIGYTGWCSQNVSIG